MSKAVVIHVWLTIKEAATYARVSPRLIRKWLKSGLKHIEMNRKVKRINVHDLDDFLRSHPSPPSSPQLSTLLNKIRTGRR